jgi:hypothetical protein
MLWLVYIETRRSRSGYTFHVGLGCVSHQSKKQPTVALSTCEAEYLALTSAVKEMQWLRLLLSELGFEQQATKMYQDNTASIQLANGKGHRKHIDIRRQFCKEAVDQGDMEPEYCETGNMIADILPSHCRNSQPRQGWNCSLPI